MIRLSTRFCSYCFQCGTHYAQISFKDFEVELSFEKLKQGVQFSRGTARGLRSLLASLALTDCHHFFNYWRVFMNVIGILKMPDEFPERGRNVVSISEFWISSMLSTESIISQFDSLNWVCNRIDHPDLILLFIELEIMPSDEIAGSKPVMAAVLKLFCYIVRIFLWNFDRHFYSLFLIPSC